MSSAPEATTVDIPLFEQPAVHDRRWFLLGIMCLSLVMVVMAVSGLNVAIPSIQQSLGATATDLQWIIDSYAIIFAGLLLLAGAIGDRFGRKRALQGGIVLFRRRIAPRHGGRLGRNGHCRPNDHGRRRSVHHARDPLDHLGGRPGQLAEAARSVGAHDSGVAESAAP